MEAMSDIVTSINSFIKNAPGNQFEGSNIPGAMEKENMKSDSQRTSSEFSHPLAINSFQRRLHIVVQYLLYFRNTDGSFGEPIVEQSSR